MEYTYVVECWKHRSECSYAFGPFESEKAARVFAEKLEANPTWAAPIVTILNSPTLVNTGKEVS